MEFTIGFSSPKDFRIGSSAIKSILKTPYSHVYIKVLDDCTGNYIVYEAAYGYFHCLEYNNFKDHNIVDKEFTYNISQSEYTQILKYSQNLLQKKYGYMAIIGIYLKDKLGIKGIGDDDDKRIICSEYAYNVLRILGMLDKVENADYITPLDVRNLVDKL
jgi:hypothetical protein